MQHVIHVKSVRKMCSMLCINAQSWWSFGKKIQNGKLTIFTNAKVSLTLWNFLLQKIGILLYSPWQLGCYGIDRIIFALVNQQWYYRRCWNKQRRDCKNFLNNQIQLPQSRSDLQLAGDLLISHGSRWILMEHYSVKNTGLALKWSYAMKKVQSSPPYHSRYTCPQQF